MGLASTMVPAVSATTSASGYAWKSVRKTASEPGSFTRTSRRRDRRHEDVAGAAHRFDDLRIVGVVLELLAQPAHLHVDRAVERSGLAAPRFLQQEVARK